FAKSVSRTRALIPESKMVSWANDDHSILAPLRSVYDSLHLNLSGLSKQAYEHAKKGMAVLIAQGKLVNDSILAVIDFSLPSNVKRLFILDTRHYKLLHVSLVAHGKNSGTAMAHSFSNQPESFKSSPGFYITGNTYNGHNGYSLKLEGVESGINDNAYERAIVMHGADYVSQSFVKARGYAGRSEGCPAVPVNQVVPIINTIKDGSCLFIYTPDHSYLDHSPVLK
ncbi:MAG TPA: murein L,D-transpeptidase catalytic domain family protein, partial [Chitinophagaceae bacterium]|nr:murein L,D-transpeptidase catalytic domain family protein [Chitinophagaceae bacterium]